MNGLPSVLCAGIHGVFEDVYKRGVQALGVKNHLVRGLAEIRRQGDLFFVDPR